MNFRSSTTFPAGVPSSDAPASARTALKLLERLRTGTLLLQLPDGSVQCFGEGGLPHAAVTLRNWKPLTAALTGGDIGFAEGYIAGDVYATELLELQPQGRIIGNVHYKRLEMHSGATVAGTLTHQESGEPEFHLAMTPPSIFKVSEA